MDVATGLGIYGAVLATATATPAILGFVRSRTPAVAWEVEPISNGHFNLRNVGRKTAHAVRVTRGGAGALVTQGLIDSRDIPAGRSQSFVVATPSMFLATGWEIELTWRGRKQPTVVPLPANPPAPPPAPVSSWGR